MTAPIDAPRLLNDKQRELVQSILEGLSHSPRVHIVSGTSTGKTRMGFEVWRALGKPLAGVTTSTIELVRQALSEYARLARDSGQMFYPILVCSDDEIQSAEYAWLRGDAEKLGILPTTDPYEIADSMRAFAGENVVVFSTHHSTGRVGEALKIVDQALSLLIVDECHRTVGDLHNPSGFGLCHRDEIIPAKHRLYMTGTERRLQVKRAGFSGMEDPEVFGPCVGRFTRAEAEALGLRVPAQLVLLATEQESVAALIEGNALISAEEKEIYRQEAQHLAGAHGVLCRMKEAGRRKALVANNSVAGSKEIAAMLRRLLTLEYDYYPTGVPVFHISASTPTTERVKTIDAYKAAHTAIMCVARCLTEGFNCPDIDLVALLDPRHASGSILQLEGRGARAFTGKREFDFLVPVPVNGTEAQALYEDVIYVVNELTDEDNGLVEFLVPREDAGPASERRTPVVFNAHGATTQINLDAFVNSIRPQAIRSLKARGKFPWATLPEWQEWCRSQGIRTQEAYYAAKKPENLPGEPRQVYDLGWRELFGKPEFISLDELRERLRAEGIDSYKQYKAWDRPADCPAAPERVYGVSWRELFGRTKRVSDYVPLDDWRQRIKAEGINTSTDYTAWIKRTREPGFAGNPSVAYNMGWGELLEKTRGMCQKGLHKLVNGKGRCIPCAKALRKRTNEARRRPRRPRRLRTHCGRGHEFTPENTYLHKSGRLCRACQRMGPRPRAPRAPVPQQQNKRSPCACGGKMIRPLKANPVYVCLTCGMGKRPSGVQELEYNYLSVEEAAAEIRGRDDFDREDRLKDYAETGRGESDWVGLISEKQ